MAQTAAVTIDGRAPTLEKGDAGSSTASLGFTNLTGKPVTLTPTPSDKTDQGCTLSLDKPTLPAAEHTDVTVTIPAGCNVRKDGIDFTVSAGGTTPPAAFAVTAAPKPDASNPEWDALWAFPIALGALLLGATVFFFVWRTGRTPPNQPLKSLDATWSFSDSWVSNVTVVGGLLTGIFGSSDVVTSLLGKEADNSVALATVGAAFAVALIAAGPIVLLATKSKDGDFFTVGGLLAASAVTLAGAFGELWVVYRSGKNLDLGGWEDKICILAAVAGVLLLLYALRSLFATLTLGAQEPEATPSDTIVAATLIVEALKAHDSINEQQVMGTLEQFQADYPVATGAAAAPPRPRRSALL